MAVPDYIDVRVLCRTSLRHAGQPLPSAAMVEECVNVQFQDVKSDFQFAAPTHPLLTTMAIGVTVKGVREYAQPADLHQLIQILLLDGPHRGTFASATTLASDVDADEDTLVGRTLVLTGGTGALQWKFITGWNNTTKTPTLDSAWTTTPDTTTTYLIADRQTNIFNANKTYGLDAIRSPGRLGCPTQAANFGEKIWTDIAPDKVYVLWYEYYADISKLDEDGALMKKLLREKLGFFIQGLVAKNMRLFDDDRVRENLQIYDRYLLALSNETKRVGQTVPFG